MPATSTPCRLERFADAGADVAPERLEIALAQYFASVVAEPPLADPVSNPLHLEPRARSMHIPLACAIMPPPSARHSLLHSIISALKPRMCSGQAERKPCDAASNDQDCLEFGHGLL